MAAVHVTLTGLSEAATLGESLVLDDVAGETDQDRCQGGDSCPKGHLPDGRGGGSTGVIPSYFGSHRPLARARLVQWMNENHMKTSVTTGEVSLRWAKKADQRAKSSENGPISPNCYLLGLRRRLDDGPRRQKYHENAGNNHLKTVNIRSNGKSRLMSIEVDIYDHNR